MMHSFLSGMIGLPWVWDLLVKANILLALAWAAHLVLGRANPYWRLMVYRSIGTGMLALPLLILLVPAISVTVPVSAGGEKPLPWLGGEFGPAEMNAPADFSAPMSPENDPVIPESKSVPNSCEEFQISDHGPELLMCVWVAGFILLVCRRIAAAFRLRRVLWTSTDAGQELQYRLRRTARELGVDETVRLRIAEEVRSPMLAGLFRPVILLPRHMVRVCNRQETSAVFAHELTHLKNRDLLWTALLSAQAGLLWWHPLSWLLCRMHGQACEEACDAGAAEFMGDADTYSRTLARLALAALTPSPRLAGIPMARPAEIMQRLSRLSAHLHVSRPAFARVLAGGAVFGVAVLILSGLQVVGLAADPSRSPSTNKAHGFESVGVPAARVLHFPADRSFGRLFLQDTTAPREIKSFYYHVDEKWEPLGEARGEVPIPAGKRVHLMVESEGWRNLSPLGRLAPDDLYQLSFAGSGMSAEESQELGTIPVRNAPDSVMPHVSRLTGLKVLDLQQTDVGAKALRHLEKLKSLECLSPPRSIDDAAMLSIAKLTALKRLYFKANKVTDKGLAHLAALANLEELELGGTEMGDGGLAHLAGLPELNYLMLWGHSFTDEGMKHLKGIRSLRTLVLFGTENVSDAGLSEIANVSTLQRLSLPWMKHIGDEGASRLARLSDLRQLDISYTKTTDLGAGRLQQLGNLELLDVPSSISEPALVKLLGTLPHLRSLRCGGTSQSPYSDDLLAAVGKLSDLESLSVGGKLITDEGMGLIGKCRKLRELTLYRCSITDKGLADIGRLDFLERLAIYNGKLTTSGLRQLNGLTRLTKLHISTVLPGPDYLDLSRLANLRDLTIGASPQGEPLRDADVACLAKLENLTRFQMEHCRGIGDAGLAHLRGLTGLTRLAIGGQVTDAGLAHLAGMKQLESLTISGNLTEKGLLQLQQNPSLALLWVVSPQPLSDSFASQLRSRLPRLYTIRYGKDLGSTRVLGMTSGSR